MEAIMSPEEIQPLIGSGRGPASIADHGTGLSTRDGALGSGSPPLLVDFDPRGDPDNPKDWPDAFKWCIVALLAAMAFTVTFTCVSVVPVASRIALELDGASGGDSEPSSSSSVLLVTIWELGEAAGPLLIAPLSEMFGRYPLMNATTVLFVVATALAAASHSTSLFIAARALTGLAVASNVLNPAIVGDMFPAEQRGAAMSAVMLAPLMGGAVGPAVAGAVVETWGWRRLLWVSTALAAVCELLFLTCFRETYKVPILRRRAARLRAETGIRELKSAFDDDDDVVVADDTQGRRSSEGGRRHLRRLCESVMRPVLVLWSSDVLLTVSIFGSVVFAYFYVMAVTLPDILLIRYQLSPALTGVSFLSFTAGSILSVVVCNRTLDRIYIALRNSRWNKVRGADRPEFRLPLAVVGAVAMPLPVAMYGWAAELQLPVWLVLLSVALMGFTLLLSFLPLMAYIVDAFGLYAASAMTAVIVTRCLASTFLPLAIPPLVDDLGYGWAFSLCAVLSTCIAPMPALVMRYGHHWRLRSVYSRDA